MANNVEIVLKAVDQTGGVFSKLGASMISLQSGIMLAEKGFQALSDAYKATIGQTVDYTSSVIDMSRVLGITTEDTSKLIQASDDLFISQEKLNTALLAASRQGIDVSISGLKSISQEYLSLGAGAERAQFLMKTFGRSGADMGKLMEVGAGGIEKMTSAIADNLIVTEEGAANVIAYKQAIDELTDSWTGIKNEAGNFLIPILTKVMNTLQYNTEWNRRLRYETDRLNISWRGGVGTLEDGTHVTAEFIDELISLDNNWGRFDKMSGSLDNVAGSADDVATAVSGVITKVRELDNIDITFGDDIASQIAKMKFYDAGGEDLQVLKEKIADFWESTGNTAQAEEFYQQLGIGAQAALVLAGEKTAYEAKQIIVQTLGLTWDEATAQLNAWLADVDGKRFSVIMEINHATYGDPMLEAKELALGQDLNGNGIIGKALGGPVWSNTPYVVGEKGPELFMPNQSGKIIPNDKLGGSNVTFYGDAYFAVDREITAQDIMKQMRVEA